MSISAAVIAAIVEAVAVIGSAIATNASNKSISEENREAQTNLANSAHQREVNDLRLAGLNPILSATGGNGAGSPPAQMIAMQSPYQGTNISSAFKAASDISLNKLKEKESISQENKNYFDAWTTEAAGKAYESQALVNSAQAAKTSVETRQRLQELIKQKRENQVYQMNDWTKKWLPVVDKVFESIPKVGTGMKAMPLR